MKLHRKAEFDPCPNYEGEAVCVDVTPLKTLPSDFGKGERDVFQIVFEVNLERENAPEDQSPRFVVWSSGFTPSLSKKSNFLKFIQSWFGRSLTDEETEEFDTEALIGRPAFLFVEQKEVDEKIFSNIIMIRPSKKPIKPSGKFTRKQDRDGDSKGAKSDDGGGGRRGASYKTTTGGKEPKPDRVPTEEEIAKDPGIVRVHVGSSKGHELSDLPPEDVEILIEKWLERDLLKQGSSLSPADKRLRQALRLFKKRFAKEAEAGKSKQSDNDGGEGDGDPEGEPVGAGKEPLDY